MKLCALNYFISVSRFLNDVLRSFSVKANGGTTVQIARNQPSLYVIYGGSTTRKHWFLIVSFRLICVQLLT